jgi:hypothetical protein
MHANPGAIVTYQFSVGGKAYEKCMYQKYPISDLTMSPAVKALKDKLVIAYYDPADPNQSISPDIGRIYAEGNSFWLGLECMGVFFAVLMWLLFKDMARFGGGDASSLRTSR